MAAETESKGKELTIKGPGDLVFSKDVAEQSHPDLDPRDVKLATLKLLQYVSGEVTSKKNLEAGHWYLSMPGTDLGEEVVFTALSIIKTRAYFVEKALKCYAPDAKVGIGSQDGALCRDCLLGKWGESREAPQCQLVYNYPVLVMINNKWLESLYLLRMSSTQTPIAKEINSYTTTGNIPIYAYKFHLGVRKIGGAKGEYFVPRIISNDFNVAADIKVFEDALRKFYPVKDEAVKKATESGEEDSPLPF